VSLNTVTLTWDLTDFLQAGVHATLALTPNAVLTDSTNHLVIPEVQHSVQFINGTGSLPGIIACDNSTILPSGWAYSLTVSVLGQGQILNETVQINFASGATQDLASLIPLSPAPSLLAYLPLPSGTPTPGYVPVATGTSEGSVWGPNGTGGSGYPALPVVSGTPSAGQVLTATSGTAAGWQTPSGGGGGINPPAGDIGGTAGAPTVVSTHLSAPLPVAQGGTGQATQQAALDALAGAQTAAQYLRGNGTHVAMSAIQAADVPTLNQNTTGTAANITGTLDQVPAPAANVSLNSHKVTNLANGTAATDAAAFGQIPSSLPPNGAAGGALTGTYPNPGLATVTIAEGGTGQVTAGAAFSALSPLTTLGDILYENATPAPARLAGNTTATKNFLTQTGNGTVSAAPAWGTIAAGDVPTLNQNTTGTAGNVTGTVAVANGGTGQVTQQAAMDALAGAQTSGNFLRGNGTHVVMAAIAAGDVPTLNQNTTGSSASCTGNAATATNLAGGATLPAYLAPKAVTLTFVASGTTLVDASLGNAFNLTLTASTTTLGNPSNPVDGEVIRVRISQDATGSRTLAYGTSYDFGAAGAPVLSTGANKVDILGFEYVASISKWCYVGSGLGF
jgi:hypothetical protein